MRILVLTGLSGSGKSTAIRAFEDRGYYCVDNLPTVLIPQLVEVQARSAANLEAVVLGIDVRERKFLADFQKVAEQLRGLGHEVELIFLEAGDEELIRRFSETRRRHPLAGVDIRAALEQEKEMLASFRENADRIIDSSGMTVHQLKSHINDYIDARQKGANLSITLISFGFKHGVPLECNLMYDVRFLPNPHFVADLKPKTGCDPDVYDYVMRHDESKETLSRIEEFLRYSIPLFEKEGRSYLVVGVGCTGGRHRSVAMVNAIETFLKENMPDYNVLIRHRDMDNK